MSYYSETKKKCQFLIQMENISESCRTRITLPNLVYCALWKQKNSWRGLPTHWHFYLLLGAPHILQNDNGRKLTATCDDNVRTNIETETYDETGTNAGTKTNLNTNTETETDLDTNTVTETDLDRNAERKPFWTQTLKQKPFWTATLKPKPIYIQTLKLWNFRAVFSSPFTNTI